MSRLALLILALLASITLTFASPVPVVNGELVDMEKRTTRKGRVRSRLFLIIAYTNHYTLLFQGTWYYPGSAHLL